MLDVWTCRCAALTHEGNAAVIWAYTCARPRQDDSSHIDAELVRLSEQNLPQRYPQWEVRWAGDYQNKIRNLF